MARRIKKIIAQGDIDSLRPDDLVRVSGYGRMMVNSLEADQYTFLGRQKSRSKITEVQARKDCLFPEGHECGRGNMRIDLPYTEGKYQKNSTTFPEEYDQRNDALRTRGGI